VSTLRAALIYSPATTLTALPGAEQRLVTGRSPMRPKRAAQDYGHQPIAQVLHDLRERITVPAARHRSGTATACLCRA
jgi:hypothetical protein